MCRSKTLLIISFTALVCGAVTTAAVVGQEKAKPAAAGAEQGLTATQLREREKAATDAMKGTWVLQKTLLDGKEQADQFEYRRWHFDGRSAKDEYKPLDGPARSSEYSVTVNPTTDPPEMNVHGKDMLLLAVYRQDGDRMRIAVLGRAEVERPRSFDPKDKRVRDMPLIVWELTRRK
jgi:uncharacterized protein (TIGR03067 family)